jgi:hypothetical protein
VANAGFRGGVRIGGIAEPSAFGYEAFEAAGPLMAEFVNVVGAHLVDNEKNDELRLRRRFRGSSGRRLLG